MINIECVNILYHVIYNIVIYVQYMCNTNKKKIKKVNHFFIAHFRAIIELKYVRKTKTKKCY